MEPLGNETCHHAIVMSRARHSGNTFGLRCRGGLFGIFLKKKGKVAEERAGVLNVIKKITEEGRFNHWLQVCSFSEGVK